MTDGQRFLAGFVACLALILFGLCGLTALYARLWYRYGPGWRCRVVAVCIGVFQLLGLVWVLCWILLLGSEQP